MYITHFYINKRLNNFKSKLTIKRGQPYKTAPEITRSYKRNLSLSFSVGVH